MKDFNLYILIILFLFACNKNDTSENCIEYAYSGDALITAQRVFGKEGDQTDIRDMVNIGGGCLYYSGLFNEKTNDFYTVIVGQNGTPDTIPQQLQNKKVYQFGKIDAELNIIWAISTSEKIQKILLVKSANTILNNSIAVLSEHQFSIYDQNGEIRIEKKFPTEYFRNMLITRHSGGNIEFFLTGNCSGWGGFQILKISETDLSIFNECIKTPDPNMPNASWQNTNICPNIFSVVSDNVLINNYKNETRVYSLDGTYINTMNSFFPIGDIRFFDQYFTKVQRFYAMTTFQGMNIQRRLPKCTYTTNDFKIIKEFELPLFKREIYESDLAGVWDANYTYCFKNSNKLCAIGQIIKVGGQCSLNTGGIEIFDFEKQSFEKRFLFSNKNFPQMNSIFIGATEVNETQFIYGKLYKEGTSESLGWIIKIKNSSFL